MADQPLVAKQPSEGEDAEAVHQGTLAVSSVVVRAASAVAEVIGDPLESLQRGFRLLRSAQAGDFARQWKAEVEDLVRVSAIKADYLATPQARTLFTDTLETAATNTLDDEQLDLLRKLFIAAAKERSTDRSSLMPREYLSIGKSLTAPEIHLLAATHSHLKEWRALNAEARLDALKEKNWVSEMKRRSGLTHATLIESYGRRLAEKGLIFGRPDGDAALRAITKRNLYRLTDLGEAFCEYLASSNTPNQSDNGRSTRQR